MERKKRALQTKAPETKKQNKPATNSDTQFDFMDEKLTLENLQLGTDSPAQKNLLNRINRAGWFISNSSPEFENVKADLEEIKTATDFMSKDESCIVPRNVQALMKSYSQLLKDCNKYLKHKENQNKIDAWSWTPTGRRISAVKAVAAFCKGKIEVLQKAVDNTLDKEAVDKKEIREMKNDAQKLMIEGMSKEEVGKYMKSLIDLHSQNPDNKQMTAKLGQQVDMCIEYTQKNGGKIEHYNLTQDDMNKARTLLQEGRIANAELKKDPEEKTTSIKAAVLLHK